MYRLGVFRCKVLKYAKDRVFKYPFVCELNLWLNALANLTGMNPDGFFAS
jgi:hypothetical protein